MANFSVEWLSQSFYNTSTDQVDIEEDTTHDRTRSRMPCVVVPRAPSTYNQVGVEPKGPTEVILHVDMNELATKDDYTPSSPNSSCIIPPLKTIDLSI